MTSVRSEVRYRREHGAISPRLECSSADIVAHNAHEGRGQTSMSTEHARSYAGDITPEQAWKLLSDNPQAVLVDVRTDAEWRFVGVPDLSSLGREVVYIEWNTSDGKRNENFLAELRTGCRRQTPIRESGRWCSCVARVTARSAPPRSRPRRASLRPTTCWTVSKAISMRKVTAVTPAGGQSDCPGNRGEAAMTRAGDDAVGAAPMTEAARSARRRRCPTASARPPSACAAGCCGPGSKRPPRRCF